VKTGAAKPPIKWAAQVSHVREVSLLGTADLVYWKERLRSQNLFPAERDGHCQVLIVAADLKFMGIRFRELSLSVMVSYEANGARQDAVYLVGAFNSNRVFAWFERVWFSTPYAYGGVQVSASVPASFSLVTSGQIVLRAQMEANASASPREPSRRGAAAWETPVFLPRSERSKHRDGKVFFGRLSGHATAFPFLPSTDAVTIRPSRGSEFLQALVDSHFVATEWTVREDAMHAKSKTYTRTEMLARM
jgi:hypothetical protein